MYIGNDNVSNFDIIKSSLAWRQITQAQVRVHVDLSGFSFLPN